MRKDVKKKLWSVYNPDKSASVTYSETEYRDYYKQSNPNIKYTITPSRK